MKSEKCKMYGVTLIRINELPVIGFLCYAQRALGSERDKRRKLLQ